MSCLDLWGMLPKYNRRSDVTGDLRRFIGCLQVPTDELCAEIDRFPDIFDLERAPERWVDLILRDLGCPFDFDLDLQGKRRLAAALVQMYREKGTAVGIRNVIRFFLGIDVEAVSALFDSTLVLGESELGIDWELGPSDLFSKYAFTIVAGRTLTPIEREQIRSIVNHVKPAHTHFLALLEPAAPVTPAEWVLGVSLLGETSVL